MLINIEFGAYPQQTQSFEVLSALTGQKDSNQKTEGKMQNQAVFAAAFSSSFLVSSVYTLETNPNILRQETPKKKWSPRALLCSTFLF